MKKFKMSDWTQDIKVAHNPAYVIQNNNPRAGFFSILSSVIGHLKIAHDNGLIPIVDLSTTETYYTESSLNNCFDNVWEYYFNPVSELKTYDLMELKNVIYATGHPKNMPFPYSHLKWVPEMVKKFISFNSKTNYYLEDLAGQFAVSQKTLGVHFRTGSDMRNAPSHPLPPSRNQLFKLIDKELDYNDLNRIYLATDTQSELAYFSKRYGDRVIYQRDIQRIMKQNEIDPRDRPIKSRGGYLLGLSVLSDAFLLSKCGSLIAGYSGVTQASKIFNIVSGGGKKNF
jgi:hypothetical protein